MLGSLPDAPQPGQKMFESLLWGALAAMDPSRVVFVEAESRKIGVLRVPEALIEAMWAADCVQVELDLTARVRLLLDDYRHFLAAPATLIGDKLDCLTALHGRVRVAAWKDLAQRGTWQELVASLLRDHYDPAYTRSTARNYPLLARALGLHPADESPAALATAARELLAQLDNPDA